MPDPESPSSFTYGTITFCGKSFQNFSVRVRIFDFPAILRHRQIRSHYPSYTTHAGFNVQTGLGSFLFARRYSGNRSYFLFLEVLRCFSSLRSPRPNYVFIGTILRHSPERVSPFGNPRIYGCLHLPEAYRSLPRPSSPSGTKASTMCP